MAESLEPNARRSADRDLRLLLATPTGLYSGNGWTPYAAGGSATADAPDAAAPPGSVDGKPPLDGVDIVVLVGPNSTESILIRGVPTKRMPRTPSAQELSQNAESWRYESQRIDKRQQLSGRLIAFFQQLTAAETVEQVYSACAVHALEMVGGFTSLVLLRDRKRGMLRSSSCESDESAKQGVCLLWDERFATPGLIDSLDARQDGAVPGAVPLFYHPHVTTIAHVPLGGDAVLVLTERRTERIFDAEEWNVLQVLSLQSEMALKRVQLLERVRTLALTDSLTGLANRHHMDIVLKHSWAAAQRGKALSLMILDLNRFKEVNDQRGHLAGDEILCRVAEALRSEARASDVVVRYGGDEFLVLFPDASVEAAAEFTRRVRGRLPAEVMFSVGTVGHHPGMSSPEEMIREADRRLYEAKCRGESC